MNESGSSPSTPGMATDTWLHSSTVCFQKFGGERQSVCVCIQIIFISIYIYYTTEIIYLRIYGFTMYCIIRSNDVFHPNLPILQCFPLPDLSFDVKPVIQVTLVPQSKQDQIPK